MKQHGFRRAEGGFLPIHMPKNTAAGVVLAAISLVLGFALVWHIWWLAIASSVALVIATIVHTFNYQRDYNIPAAEVAATEAARTRQLASAHA